MKIVGEKGENSIKLRFLRTIKISLEKKKENLKIMAKGKEEISMNGEKVR